MPEITEVSEMHEIAGQRVGELSRSPDIPDSKERVVSTFTSAFSLLENTPDDQLSPEEKWTKKSISEARDKTIGQDKKTFVTPEYDDRSTGGRTSQEESIPIEGLVKFLSKDIDTLPEDQKQQRLEQIAILLRNSRQYTRIPGRMEPNRFVNRVAYEAQLIHQDERNTHDQLKDWVLARKTLNQRIELQIPDEAPENQVTPPPVGQTTEQQTAPVDEAEQERQRSVTERLELLRKLHERSVVLGNAQVVREQEARAAAERRFHEEQRQGRWWNPVDWVKKTNLRLQQDRYVNKWAQEYMDLARDRGVLFSNMGPIHEGLSVAQLQMATRREKSQAVEAVAEKTLRAEMTQHGPDGKIGQADYIKESGNAEVNNLVYGLITRFARGEIMEADFPAEREAILEKLKNNPETADFFAKAENLTDLADNLLETARDVKTLHQIHQVALEDLTDSLDIQVANLRAVLGTRADIHNVRIYDRIFNKISSTRGAGWFINPATIAAAGSLGFYGVSYLASGIRTGFSTAGVTIGGPAAPIFGALTGGVFAGFRRAAEVNKDFALNERDIESGAAITGKRREILSGYGMEKAKATDLIAEVKALTRGDLLTESRQKALIDRIAEINARESFSDTHQVAMFQFEENTKIAQNRTDLLRIKAEAKVALRDTGLTDAQIMEWLNESVTEYKGKFLEDKQQQTREFRGYRLKESAKAAGFGFVVGMAASVVIQEGVAEGLRAFGHHVKDTMAESVIHGAANLFHHEAPTHANPDLLTAIFQKGGTADLGNHIQAMSNPQQHVMSFINTDTHQPIAQGTIENGALKDTVVGNGLSKEATDHLHQQLSDAGFRDITLHQTALQGPSTLDQVKDLASSGREGTFHIGSADLSIDSSHNFIFTDPTHNLTLHGLVDPQTGELTFDQTQNPGVDFNALKDTLHQAGFSSSPETQHGGGPTNALEHFRGKQEVEHTNRLLWHDNGTPMHLDSRGVLVGADGKELQFYHHVTPDQGIDLDMSKMISHSTPRGWQNWDFTVDNQYNHVVNDIIANQDGTQTYRNFEFLITPNDAANAAREAIVVQVDSTGHTILPDGSDLHQFFEIRNGQPVQLAKFIEVAHVEHDASGAIHRTILATSVGQGIDNINTPPVEIIHATPPGVPSQIPHYAFDALPPIPGQETPSIPIAFAPRNPLEPLIIPPPGEGGYGYYGSAFGAERYIGPDGQPYRVQDLIRFSNADQTRRILRERGIRGAEPREGREEGQEVVDILNESFINTEHVYVVMSGAIGDSVLTTAYLEGIKNYTAALNQHKEVVLMVPDNIIPIIQPLVDQNNADQTSAVTFTIMSTPRGSGVETASSIINAQNQRAMVFDFEYRQDNPPRVDVLENGSLIVKDMFAPSLGLYPVDRAGAERFSQFFRELLQIPDSVPINARPHIELPANSEEVYQNMINQYGIDIVKQQVAIVVEASLNMKRYSMDQWAEIMRNIAQQQPNVEFNIIYNPSSREVGFSPNYLRQAIQDIPGARLVSGNIQEMMVLLGHSDLVMANDTGLAHIAAALPEEPNVITLHIPLFPPNTWIGAPERHIGFLPRNEDLKVEFNSEETDEARKWINAIRPADVTGDAIELLNGRVINRPTPPSARRTGQAVTRVGRGMAAGGSSLGQAVQGTATAARGNLAQSINTSRANLGRIGQRVSILMGTAERAGDEVDDTTLNTISQNLDQFTLDTQRIAENELAQLRTAAAQADANLRGRAVSDLTRLSAETQLLRIRASRLNSLRAVELTQRLDALQSTLNQSLREVNSLGQPEVPEQTQTQEDQQAEAFYNRLREYINGSGMLERDQDRQILTTQAQNFLESVRRIPGLNVRTATQLLDRALEYLMRDNRFGRYGRQSVHPADISEPNRVALNEGVRSVTREELNAPSEQFANEAKNLAIHFIIERRPREVMELEDPNQLRSFGRALTIFYSNTKELPLRGRRFNPGQTTAPAPDINDPRVAQVEQAIRQLSDREGISLEEARERLRRGNF